MIQVELPLFLEVKCQITSFILRHNLPWTWWEIQILAFSLNTFSAAIPKSHLDTYLEHLVWLRNKQNRLHC